METFRLAAVEGVSILSTWKRRVRLTKRVMDEASGKRDRSRVPRIMLYTIQGSPHILAYLSRFNRMILEILWHAKLEHSPFSKMIRSGNYI